jgi:hypothetical protein
MKREPKLKNLDLRFSGRKVHCVCCGRVWVEQKSSITKPCRCAETIMCERCNHCLAHCECV